MTTERKQTVSDAVLARVITPIALYPRRHSCLSLAHEARITTSMASVAVGKLLAHEWVGNAPTLAVPGKLGRPQKLYETTEVFEATVRQVVDHITNDASEREATLFRQAVVDRRQLVEARYLNEKMDDEAAARYLGRVVLLGEAHDLGDAGWLSGMAGWRSLVEIAADRSFVSTAAMTSA